jgi:hypothetical protein
MRHSASNWPAFVACYGRLAPRVTRAAVLRDSANPAGSAQFAAIQATASSIGVEVSPINVRDAGEIERAVATFARLANGGLIVTGSASGSVHRDLMAEAPWWCLATGSVQCAITGSDEKSNFLRRSPSNISSEC